jgi:hypothetical protein
VGQKLAAAFWNTEVDAPINFLTAPPAVKVRDTSGQTIGTNTAVTFALEDYDSDTIHAPGSGSFVIVTPGIYCVSFSVEFGTTGSAGAFRDVRIQKNTAIQAYQRVLANTASTTQGLAVTTDIQCVVGDTITFNAANSTSGALSTSAYACTATAHWVSK